MQELEVFASWDSSGWALGGSQEGFQADVQHLHPAPALDRLSRACPAPRWAAGCSHNSCSPSPATQTQQNPVLWAQPDLRTAVRKHKRAVRRDKWGKNPGNLGEEGERSWVIN